MTHLLQELRLRLGALDALFCMRTFRERLILGAGSAACVFLAIDHLAIQPVESERRQLSIRSSSLESEIESLRGELAGLMRESLSEEERDQREEIDQLRRQIEQIDTRISQEIAQLVSPEAIVSVLEDVLAELPELSLISLASQPPQRIGVGTAGDPDTGATHTGSGLYRHGLTIELQGSFAAAVRYLERLEASPWHLLWDRFDLRVQQFPRSSISIELHTISSQEEWIGV